MGEIADDILNGDSCEICGQYFDDEGYDHPRKCSQCFIDAPSSNGRTVGFGPTNLGSNPRGAIYGKDRK